MRVFALGASRAFGEAVAAALGVALAAHEEREFEDGEHKARPLEGVRGADVYVVQGLHGGPEQSPNDKLCRLLFFLGAVRDAGAARVTAVIPYLAYARKDRRTKPRDPLTTRYVAQLLEAMGVDAVVTFDVHNVAAFQNAFRCRAEHLDSRLLFARRLHGMVGDGPVVVASPDPGGVKRAQLFRETFEATLGREVGAAFMEKRRSGGVVSGELLVGEVAGATVVVVDDLIASGGTMRRAAEACLSRGAARVLAVAAHGLFTGGAAEAIAAPALARTLVTDTVPPFRLPPGLLGTRVEVVGAAPLFAAAIRRLHEGGSITDLLERGD
ncbi:ribose-phosphate diphosphokinase [Caldovatus aquaticus]|uniref:ribose-phosphate diphosphokinase n=1 Tax=Caldovatus aquaticus TaxID=2865671 RepID=A0ABS7F1A7_9PROT|nr:ribose-phosphate diphosphokinase [Caldovatus aquaticus]MBW8269402.1 ribose-phosphate diphosphokinase [Caldovatus aquaticus]